MLNILIRASCFVAIIVLGVILRKVGLFKREDFTVLSKITIKITLPAAIITSFAGKQIEPDMLTIALLGLGGGMIYMLLGFLTNLRAPREKRAFEVLNLPGYNIGNFTLPFVQSFLGPTGVIITSLFDTGNAFVCLGGAYGVASMIKDGRGFDLRRLGKALLTSVPFLTYIIMVTMNLTKLPIPAPIVECAGIIGSANAFIAMFMLGVGFQLSAEREQIGSIIKILLLRYAVAAVLALVFYFLLPFPLEARRALVILAFSPIGSAVPAFTAEMKSDTGLSSAINSISIVISIVIIVTLLSVMLPS
jgi:predicted permease